MSAAATNNGSTSFHQRLFRKRPEDSLPLKIQHQRIYILPTRRGLAFLFSLLIMLIASVNYALSLGYALCFLLTGLFAASLLHTYKNVAGITVKNLAVQNTFAGDSVLFSLAVENDTNSHRIGVTLKTNGAKDTIDIPVNGENTAKLHQVTTTRGTCPLGRVTITSTYPLGLWRTWCYLHTDAYGIVFPKPELSPPPLPAKSDDASGEQNQRSNHGDIDGVREYQVGDAISSIAWKAAARGQGLFVKTFEQNNSGGEVSLSLAATGLTDTEKRLSRLCAWVLSAEHAQVNYVVELPGYKTDAAQGDRHKVQTLTALALFGLEK